MHAEVRKVDCSFHVLEITATSDDLEDDVKRAVRKLKGTVQMKGFRPGHVPAHLLKRVYRPELSESVGDTFVEEVFTDLVKESGAYDVLGNYSVDQLEYALDHDLKAELCFNVLPEIDFEALKEVEVKLFSYAAAPEDVERNKRSILRGHSYFRPLEEDEQISADDTVDCTLQELDKATRTVIIGGHSEQAKVDLTDELIEPYLSLRNAVIGSRISDTVYFESVETGDTTVIESLQQQKFFSVLVQDAKRLVLPDLDEEIIESETDGQCSTEDELDEYLTKALNKTGSKVTRQLNTEVIMNVMLGLYPFEIPAGLADAASRESGISIDGAKRWMRWFLIREAVDRQVLRDAEGGDGAAEATGMPEQPPRQDENDPEEHLTQEIRVVDFLAKAFAVNTVPFDGFERWPTQ